MTEPETEPSGAIFPLTVILLPSTITLPETAVPSISPVKLTSRSMPSASGSFAEYDNVTQSAGGTPARRTSAAMVADKGYLWPDVVMLCVLLARRSSAAVGHSVGV